MKIPEIINNCNCYDGQSNKLIGVTGEVTLPEIEFLTETLSGLGTLGEIDAVAIGHTSALEQEVPFTNLYNDIFKLMKVKDGVHIVLRQSLQVKDSSTGATQFVPIRIVMKGSFKKFTVGNAKKGGLGEPSVTFGITYILIEINKKNKFELDKYNNVFKIDGQDMLADIKSQI
ncbi:MAG: phage major tail tube protein [Eubacterium sp.]|nr:phage major tail tube protein [Eubacterium sp.]